MIAAALSTGDGIAIAGMMLAASQVVSSIIICVAWLDKKATKEAGSNTELTPPSRPAQSRRKP